MKKSKAKILAKKTVEKETKESNSDLKILPLGDRVLINPDMLNDTEEKNNFGIIIPDTVSKERPEQGIVIAVGEGRYEEGKRIPVKVKVGDRVIFSKYGFDEVKDGDKELYILKEENILAIIKG
jgi:chaperonin GroES